MVSNRPGTFGGQKYCGSGDVMFLICHVISQDYVTQEPCDFTAVLDKTFVDFFTF